MYYTKGIIFFFRARFILVLIYQRTRTKPVIEVPRVKNFLRPISFGIFHKNAKKNIERNPIIKFVDPLIYSAKFSLSKVQLPVTGLRLSAVRVEDARADKQRFHFVEQAHYVTTQLTK